MNSPNEEDYLKEMNDLHSLDDHEEAHKMADQLLCDFLYDLGHTKLVESFDKIKKWYA